MVHSSYTFDTVHLTPREQIGLHWQSTWEISYIITGSGIRMVGDRTEPFQSGEVVMIPPEIPHCWYFNDNVTDAHGKIANTTVTFGDEFLRNCAAAFPELEEPIEKLEKRKLSAVIFDKEKAALIIALFKEMSELNTAERIAPLIRLLLLLATDREERSIGNYQKIGKEQKRLDKVRTYIICNAQRNITLDDVAHHVGTNRSAFCVFFRKATGKTFVNYLNEYRIELACQLLMQEKENVAEICYHVGFNNVPYFNRVFKKLKGVSPTAYSHQPDIVTRT